MAELSQAEQKKLVGAYAVDKLLEEGLIFSAMKIGLGTGSTAMPAVERLAYHLKEGRLLMKEIETGGNFGQYDKRNIVKDETFAHRALRRLSRRWRMVRFDPLGTIIMPFSRLSLEIWMRCVRRKYSV